MNNFEAVQQMTDGYDTFNHNYKRSNKYIIILYIVSVVVVFCYLHFTYSRDYSSL